MGFTACLSYWWRVLCAAASASLETAGQTRGAIIWSILLLLVGIVIAGYRYGRDAMTRELTPWLQALIPVLVLGVLLFLFHAWKTPAAWDKAQADHIADLESRARITLEVFRANFFVPNDDVATTGLVFEVLVTNGGEPTLLKHWNLTGVVAGRTIEAYHALLSPDQLLVLRNEQGTIDATYDASQMLQQKTLDQPIGKGAGVSGILSFRVRAPKAETISPTTIFMFSAEDAWQNRHSFTIAIKDIKNVSDFGLGLNRR